jgi:hypothetical protein
MLRVALRKHLRVVDGTVGQGVFARRVEAV